MIALVAVLPLGAGDSDALYTAEAIALPTKLLLRACRVGADTSTASPRPRPQISAAFHQSLVANAVVAVATGTIPITMNPGRVSTNCVKRLAASDQAMMDLASPCAKAGVRCSGHAPARMNEPLSPLIKRCAATFPALDDGDASVKNLTAGEVVTVLPRSLLDKVENCHPAKCEGQSLPWNPAIVFGSAASARLGILTLHMHRATAAPSDPAPRPAAVRKLCLAVAGASKIPLRHRLLTICAEKCVGIETTARDPLSVFDKRERRER